MATLPMTKQASSKAVREAVITLPSHAAPEQHFKTTQLAVSKATAGNESFCVDRPAARP